MRVQKRWTRFVCRQQLRHLTDKPENCRVTLSIENMCHVAGPPPLWQ